MSIPITGLYIGLTVVVAVVLGVRIGLARARTKISILDGGNPDVALKMRQHGNLLETAALTLLAFAVIESNGASPVLLHCLGVAYIVCRILHPIGLKVDDITHPLRALGALGSTLVMVIAASIATWQFFTQSSTP